MADYQRVVEFLRDLRGSGGGLPQQVTDQVVRAAEEFAALCVSANERLRQCSTFLQQGLRSEAIHLAEQPPNLLDLVAALDLPDPEAWAEYCQNNGLAVPPALQMDRATSMTIVNRLQERDFLRRERSTSDARKQALFLTAEGEAALARAKRCIAEHEAWLKGRFTADEVKKLVEMLARIHD